MVTTEDGYFVFDGNPDLATKGRLLPEVVVGLGKYSARGVTCLLQVWMGCVMFTYCLVFLFQCAITLTQHILLRHGRPFIAAAELLQIGCFSIMQPTVWKHRIIWLYTIFEPVTVTRMKGQPDNLRYGKWPLNLWVCVWCLHGDLA